MSSRRTSAAWQAFVTFMFAFVLAAAGGCLSRDNSAPAHCTNGTVDDNESDVDCGGSCGKCTGGLKCNSGEDCTSGSCEGTCAAAEGEPVITSFEADKTKVAPETVIQLTAVFEGGVGTIDNGVGSVTTGTAVSSAPLKATTVFTLTVTSDKGVNSVRRVKVEVGDFPTITSFKAAKPAVRAGEATTLTAVFVGGKGKIDNGIGDVTSGKEIPTGNLTENKHYVLTVTNDAGDVATEAVDVEAAITPVITSFEAEGGSAVSRFKAAQLKAVFKGGKGKIDKDVGDITSGTAKASKEVPFAGESWTLTVTNGLGESTTKTLAVTTKKELFVADYAQDILVFDVDDKGDAEPKRILVTDPSVQGVLGIWIDNNELYVANESPSTAISVYNLSDGARPPYSDGGKIDMPKRRITGAATGIEGAYIFSVSGGEIFVADKSSTIKVWNATDNGNVPPKRTLTGAATGIDNALAAYVSGDELYVANYANAGDASSITVYPKSATGNAAPTRTILTQQPTSVLVEGNEIFVTDKLGEVTVYNKSTGAQLRKISGSSTGLSESYQCSVANNELFCADYVTEHVVVFPSNANGNVAPSRIIAGDHTYMSATTCVYTY